MSLNPASYRLGWHRDPDDPRDIPYGASPAQLAAVPSRVDLRLHCPPVLDQAALGSCTANAIASAFRFDVLRQAQADFVPSRLFIYYYERAVEGTVNEDAGAAIRDGIRVVNARGVCPESEWPYDIQRFTQQPPAQCTLDALKERALSYRRIPQSLPQMKACLASGLPFVFGIDVYQGFMDATDGTIPMPKQGEALLGGHALLMTGYNTETQRFTFMNSWGTGWGQQGFGTIPFDYITSQNASDFWCIRVVGSVVQQLCHWIDGLL
jgi:C1A family cysteine protease